MNVVYAQNTDYLFMIEQATKAPSGHNTQPWLFKINEASIEIHPNFDKSLPVVDPENRELFISLGCAVENLCIAASNKGYKSEAITADNGVITVNLAKQEAISADPLFHSIATRQTNRSIYNGAIISSDTLKILKQIPLDENIDVFFYENGTTEFETISDFVVRGNTLQMNDKEFTGELKSWMRFNKKHQNRTNDGLSYAAFHAPNLPMFIARPAISNALNAKRQNKGDIKKMQSSSHFILLTTRDNTLQQWIDLGRTMERFLLKSTELGIIHAYMNQPIEVEELSADLTKALHIDGFPTILLRIGYGDKMPYSKRVDISDVIMQ